MTTKSYRTVNGQTLEYEATPKVAAFIRRLEEGVENPKVTEQQLIGIAYSSENPILDHTMFPGRGAVTKAVLDDPAYHVMTDLLFRKQVAEQDLDVDKLAAKYSLTVGQAAAELGIHESAVRQAIAAKRLASWVKDGKHYLDPRSLKSIEFGTRGPKKGSWSEIAKTMAKREQRVQAALALLPDPLDVVMGHEKGASLKIKPSLPEAERIAGNRLRGTLPKWKRVVVMTTGDGGSRRAFVLEPGPEENELTHGPFSVKGRFVVRDTINSSKRAGEVWDEAEVG